MLHHLLSAYVVFVIEITAYWWKTFWNSIRDRRPDEVLQDAMARAESYEGWREHAKNLDIYLSNDVWRTNNYSRYYDYKLIQHRLENLRELHASNDITAMTYLLRSGLIRNLGGICDSRLFRRSPLGTKKLIEDYMEEVIEQLEYISNADSKCLSPQAKLDFFHDTRQSFGCSALILYGGATFGLYHIGVVKSLNDQGLLPRIICGTAVGALIAALVCIHTDEELPNVFTPEGIDLTAFAHKRPSGNVKRKLKRLLKHGYLMDIKVLIDCVKANVGDLTFEEAYKKTKRVLNISVSSTRVNEVPQLLNYLTAPNVVIWSAAAASVAIMGLFETVDLLAKDKNGNVVPWSPSTVKWSDAAAVVESESHLTRLAELYNVNHFIVSQANPYIVPFLGRSVDSRRKGLAMKLAYLVLTEFKHQLSQLHQMHLLPRVLHFLIEERISGDVTIVPSLSLKDFQTLFSNPTNASVGYWITKGEQSTWPMLSLIQTRCTIELALDRIYLRLKTGTKAKKSKQPRVYRAQSAG